MIGQCDVGPAETRPQLEAQEQRSRETVGKIPDGAGRPVRTCLGYLHYVPVRLAGVRDTFYTSATEIGPVFHVPGEIGALCRVVEPLRIHGHESVSSFALSRTDQYLAVERHGGERVGRSEIAVH